MKHILFPDLDHLRAEFVLVQAWKKTAAHLRQHSWYADTLELDYQSLRLPDFIRELQEKLLHPEAWQPTPIDFVPAPKSQHWTLRDGKWKPAEPAAKSVRPLAHVALSDQVLATAMLLCVADQVETLYGNPLLSIDSRDNRRRVMAYGHRLFCDPWNKTSLHHRWGSSKLYRLYYRDYQTFLQRPESVAAQLKKEGQSQEIAIVQSDLSKFYDRVRPTLLHERLKNVLHEPAESQFLTLFKRVFNWRWQDANRARQYQNTHKIPNFEEVALPQGLAASGFFANVVLYSFASALRTFFDRPIDAAGLFILKDACYYVDDLRLVFLIEPKTDEKELEKAVCTWLQELLDRHAPGLVVEEKKTTATVLDRKRRFLVQQSKTANRIQSDVSGVFDMLHGTELIGAIEGFFHTQKRYSAKNKDATGTGLLIGISDMRDDSAARFAAGKFRRTFRSLRPLLLDEGADEHSPLTTDLVTYETGEKSRPKEFVLSKQQLDEKGQLFAATLIEEWVANPGNVRLLRIAFDLYPHVNFLDKVLGLLQPSWTSRGSAGATREIQLYCLAELFRAGATETGMVRDTDCLPEDVDVVAYHTRLRREATAILTACMESPVEKRFPWYLLQQVLLYLAAQNQIPRRTVSPRYRRRHALKRYQQVALCLNGFMWPVLKQRSILLILAHSAFGNSGLLERVAEGSVSGAFLSTIAGIAPQVAKELWSLIRSKATEDQMEAARSLGIEPTVIRDASTTLADLVQQESNPFWQEKNLLRLAAELIDLKPENWPEILSPWQIQCGVTKADAGLFGSLDAGSISIKNRNPRAGHLFQVPAWCETPEEKQRFQLGMILRFALRGSIDFYSSESKGGNVLVPRYRAPASHWEKQRYATFQGRSAFGPAWIPISSWVEAFLFELLKWPGVGGSAELVPLAVWGGKLAERIEKVKQLEGAATGLPFLEQAAPYPDGPPPGEWQRSLRIGIVQSVIPDLDDYRAHPNDPQLLTPAIRFRQRRHFAAVMESVNQMLRLRETHRSPTDLDGQWVDLIVFPELAVHPEDIESLILPFVRTRRCIALFGQVYHRANGSAAAPLINSCMWMIPEWNPTNGLQIRYVEQGKEHLTRLESNFTPAPQPFRPAQWLIDFHWHSHPMFRPLRLSASICYDATDLALACDLKSRSDLYLVCALNSDVGTFDRMSEGLHYHMYQGVVVANNGQFGGSSFYLPFGHAYHRQVCHLHGQPQANISFVEVSPRKLIDRPLRNQIGNPDGEWKTPPANWTAQP